MSTAYAHAKAVRAYRARHKAKGLCQHCPKKVRRINGVPTLNCIYHTYRLKLYNHSRYYFHT